MEAVAPVSSESEEDAPHSKLLLVQMSAADEARFEVSTVVEKSEMRDVARLCNEGMSSFLQRIWH